MSHPKRESPKVGCGLFACQVGFVSFKLLEPSLERVLEELERTLQIIFFGAWPTRKTKFLAEEFPDHLDCPWELRIFSIIKNHEFVSHILARTLSCSLRDGLVFF
jgi:hypothetical protein